MFSKSFFCHDFCGRNQLQPGDSFNETLCGLVVLGQHPEPFGKGPLQPVGDILTSGQEESMSVIDPIESFETQTATSNLQMSSATSGLRRADTFDLYFPLA